MSGLACQWLYHSRYSNVDRVVGHGTRYKPLNPKKILLSSASNPSRAIFRFPQSEPSKTIEGGRNVALAWIDA